MSAWAELVNADLSDQHLDLCSRALVEIQREMARKLAEKIRAEVHREDFGTLDAADLIDPDKE